MEANAEVRSIVLFNNAEHLALFRRRNVLRGTWKQLDDHSILATQGIVEQAKNFGARIANGRRKST